MEYFPKVGITDEYNKMPISMSFSVYKGHNSAYVNLETI